MDNRDERYYNPARYHSTSCIHMLSSALHAYPCNGRTRPDLLQSFHPIIKRFVFSVHEKIFLFCDKKLFSRKLQGQFTVSSLPFSTANDSLWVSLQLLFLFSAFHGSYLNIDFPDCIVIILISFIDVFYHFCQIWTYSGLFQEQYQKCFSSGFIPCRNEKNTDGISHFHNLCFSKRCYYEIKKAFSIIHIAPFLSDVSFLNNTFLMQILLFGCKSPTNVSFRLVHIQNFSCLACKGWINLDKTFCNVFMYRTFTNSKFFRCLPYCCIFLDYIISNINCPFFYVSLQRNPSYIVFL